jgi:hypothetical protein
MMKIKLYQLTPEEKNQIRNGQLKVVQSKIRIVTPLTQRNDAIQEFINRSNGQRGCTKPRKKRKKASTSRSAKICYPEHERSIPSMEVATYLAHLQTLRPNSYTYRINRVLGMELNDDEKAIVASLDPVPLYTLRYSNRIFCSGRWQTLKSKADESGKPLRNLLFAGCMNADLRSLHFEIYRMLLRNHVPERYVQLNTLLGGLGVWEYFENATSHVLDKGVYKIAVQALINGSSKSQARGRLLIENDDLAELGFHDHEASQVEDLLAQEGLNSFIEIVYQGVKELQRKIKAGDVADAFGEKLIPITIEQQNRLTGEWMRKDSRWKLKRKDLNRLYSSYELRILSETIVPCLGKHEFRVDLHLHDGFLFSANKKSINKIEALLEASSQRVLKSLGITSEIRFEPIPFPKLG